jgi:hypothetical protein
VIDRLAFLRLKQRQVRDAAIILWNLTGMVLMLHLMYRSEQEALPVFFVGLFMFVTALLLLAFIEWQGRK